MEKQQQKPIKRDRSLQPLSREHHHTLLLCWKIRKGFSNGIAPSRIKRYADWFFEHHILPHFRQEEEHVFPILGSEHPFVRRAVGEHRKLARLFQDQEDVGKSLGLIEEELERHIRFEERVLFNEVQAMATSEQLDQVQALHHDAGFTDNTEDEFWK